MNNKNRSTQWQSIKPSDIVTTEQSHRLRQRSDIWGAWLLLHCWAVILASAALYVLFPNPLTLLIAVILIGGRQLGLAILLHEGSHGLLFKTRALNERLCLWLAGWPMMVSLKEYRVRHMAHHRFTRSDKDPENYLYTPFPVTKQSMARKMLRDITGIVFVRTNIGIFRFVRGDKKEDQLKRIIGYYGGPLLFNSMLAAICATFGRIDLFLLLWLLPMATSFQLFFRIRNIAEHATVPDIEDPLQNSRTTFAGPIARMLVAPYWVNYHIEHHMLPFVPCYRLKETHQLMLERGFGSRMEMQDGYLKIIALNASA